MKSPRIPSLDGLRALSISLVLISHYALAWHAPYRVWWVANDYGKVGLRIFYVISGFLITTLLLKERERTGAISLKNFYIRRIYRIFPAAYVYIAVMAVVFHSSLPRKDIAIAFSYLSSYSAYIPEVLAHLWSLSVEEQFYLIWPAIMLMGLGRSRRVALGVVALAPVVRFSLMTAGRGDSVLLPVATSADALAMGCLLALLQPQLQRYKSFFLWRGFWTVWILTASVALVDLTRHGRIYQCLCLPVLHLGIALCVQNAMVAGHRWLNASVPVWLGTISYSLYLWHAPFAYLGRNVSAGSLPANLVVTLPGGLIPAFLLACISYYGIERPILRIRERRRAGQALSLAGVSALRASPESRTT